MIGTVTNESVAEARGKTVTDSKEATQMTSQNIKNDVFCCHASILRERVNLNECNLPPQHI